MCVHVLRNRELDMLVIWSVLVLHWLRLRESVLFYFVWQLKKQSTAILSDSWRHRILCYFCLTAEETTLCYFVWQLKKQNTAILSDSWSIRTICYFAWQLKKNNSTLSTLYCSIWLTAEKAEQQPVDTVLFYLTDSWKSRTATCWHCTVLFAWRLKKQNSNLLTLYCSIWLTAEKAEQQPVDTVLFYLTDGWKSRTATCWHCTVLFDWQLKKQNSNLSTLYCSICLTAEKAEQQPVDTVLFYLTDSWKSRTATCRHCTVLFDWRLKKQNSNLLTLYCSIWLTAEKAEQQPVDTVLFYLTDGLKSRTATCRHCTVLFDWRLKKQNSNLSTLYCSIWLTAEKAEQQPVDTVLFYLTDSWKSRTATCRHCTVLFDWRLKKQNSNLSTLYCSIWLTAEKAEQQPVDTVLFYLTDSWKSRTATCRHCTVLFDWQLKKQNSNLSTLYCSIWLTAEKAEQQPVDTVLFYLTDSWKSRTATCRRAMGSWWPPTRSCGSGWLRWSGRWGSCSRGCRPRNTRWTTCTGPRNTWRTTCSAWRSVCLSRPCSCLVCWFAGLQKYTQ